MRAVEFESTVAPDGHIAIPLEVASEIPRGEQLRIVVMWEPNGVDPAWRASGRARFEAAYAPEDDIYERLMDGAPIR